MVALGIGIDGAKHPLALVQGRPRTPPWCRGLVGLRERGLDVTKPILAVLDALPSASEVNRDGSGGSGFFLRSAPSPG
jgi:hypothetical protein